MRCTNALAELLRLAVRELELHADSYHHYTPTKALQRLSLAATANPNELDRILAEVTEALDNRRFRPRNGTND